ncbi:MAG: lamin tail domain-containing protein, partial [Planctomycetota bacterium]
MLKHTRISFLCVFLIIFLAHPVAANCPVGNLNDDCAVNLYDLRLFVMQWLDDPGGLANFDGQNGVDFNDFAILAGNWEEYAVILKINEFMASNSGAYADPQGQYDDWIEIYNPLGVAFDLGGMWLEDDRNQWQIPDDNPAETTIGPYGYLIIWADGDTGDSPGLHASFALDKE